MAPRLSGPEHPALPRRRVLVAGLGGAGLLVLAACSRTQSPDAQEESSPTTNADPTKSQNEPSPTSNGEPPPQQPNGLVAVSDVPVGGAVSAEGSSGPLIVSRPTEDAVVAFSAICTHQGCTVAPDGDELRCPCHGSVYEASTGRNIDGPAPSPLAEFPVRVVGGEVVPA